MGMLGVRAIPAVGFEWEDGDVGKEKRVQMHRKRASGQHVVEYLVSAKQS